MSLTRWLLAVSLVMGLGILRVAQHTTVLFQAYAVGERLQQVHSRERDIAWLRNGVLELSSPSRLASLAKERKMTLVAWSTFAPPAGPRTAARQAEAFVHVAAVPAGQTAD